MKTVFPGLSLLFAFCLASPAQSPLLSIDFNRRNSDPGTNTQAGFTSFTITSNVSVTANQTSATVRAIGPYTVSLSNSAPFGYNDRLRNTALTNNGSFTEHLLLRDFVFSQDVNTTGGLDVSISGLNPNEIYNISLWSWDQSSAGTRVSDWFVNNVLVRDNWTFDGRIYPDDNNDYRFSFLGMADPTGMLLISGRREATSVDALNVASFGVFLNALEVTPVPEPSTYALALSGAALLWFRRLRQKRSNP